MNDERTFPWPLAPRALLAGSCCDPESRHPGRPGRHSPGPRRCCPAARARQSTTILIVSPVRSSTNRTGVIIHRCVLHSYRIQRVLPGPRGVIVGSAIAAVADTPHSSHIIKARPHDHTPPLPPLHLHNAPSSRPWVPLDDRRVGPSSGQIAHPRVREARQAHRTCHRTRRSASQGQYLGPTASCVAGRATRSHLLISESGLITPSRSGQPYRWPHRGIVRLSASLYPRIYPCSQGKPGPPSWCSLLWI